MRLRKCRVCGNEFQGKGEQRLCPVCRREARAATTILDRTCISCGASFPGGPRASYCPKCREERRRKACAEYKQRKAAGHAREIGSIDICQCCGKEYVVAGGLQRYCPDCAAEAVRQAVLPHKRARAKERSTESAARKKALKEESAVCAYCGKVFTPTGPSVTCSTECAREYTRIQNGWKQYRAGLAKNPPSHERHRSNLPQSSLTGVSYHRKTGKWQVNHNGKYVGLFPTKEDAEKKKRTLEEQEHDADR